MAAAAMLSLAHNNKYWHRMSTYQIWFKYL